MANPEHLAILEKGVENWNEWRRRPLSPESGSLRRPDFSGANLSARQLSRGSLSNSNFIDANLVDARLEYADLYTARLTGAKLNGANASGVRLTQADLTDADLTGTNLYYAILSNNTLLRTNFTNATLGQMIFGSVDLSSAVGLDSARHTAPSTIGIDTIYRSKGRIPEAFLRGCGIPESFTTYTKSLVASPIEYYSLFISYSTKDQDFAERVHADLQAKGILCWFAPHDIKGGQKIHEQIDEAILLYDKVLLILSPDSMASEWVKTEIFKARKREVRDKARVLFPVRLVPFDVLRSWECFDADTGKDSAREIREYFVPDFSNWKDHDSYRKAFDQLVRDLQAPAWAV